MHYLQALLHILGTVSALFAAWFWYRSAKISPGDLEYLGKWSDDGSEEKSFIQKAAKNNSKGAIFAAASAALFGINGILQLKEYFN